MEAAVAQMAWAWTRFCVEVAIAGLLVRQCWKVLDWTLGGRR